MWAVRTDFIDASHKNINKIKINSNTHKHIRYRNTCLVYSCGVNKLHVKRWILHRFATHLVDHFSLENKPTVRSISAGFQWIFLVANIHSWFSACLPLRPTIKYFFERLFGGNAAWYAAYIKKNTPISLILLFAATVASYNPIYQRFSYQT